MRFEDPRRYKPRPSLEVSEVKIHLADPADNGFLGWASCVVNGSLHLSSIAINRSLNNYENTKY